METMIRGKTIAITRSEQDSEEFIGLMQESNATPLMLPTINLVSRGEGIVGEFLDEVKKYDPDYTVFMSSKAVRLLFDTAKKSSRFDDLRLAVANTTVVSVGPKTREALESYGVRTSHMPDRYSSVGIGEVFTALNAAGRRVLVPRSGASTPFLKQLLSKIGLDVRELKLYDVQAAETTEQWQRFSGMLLDGQIDGLIYTSASSVRAFFEITDRDHDRSDILAALQKTGVIAIGPFTAIELDRFGVKHTVSQVHTVPGALEAARAILA